MPCKSYEDDQPSARSIADQEQLDRLARIACKAMQELERLGAEDFILLGDEEVRNWWKKHKEADAKAARAAEAKRRKEELKASAIAKLSQDELRALGVKL